MGKNLTSQRGGKGTATFRAPSFRYVAAAKYRMPCTTDTVRARVTDLLHCPGHSAPLATIRYEDGADAVIIACTGIRRGAFIEEGKGASVKEGNILPLENLPVGTVIYNIESRPGDGGKFVRASGGFARIVAKTPAEITVQFPSKKQRSFIPKCRASVGVVAGSGRTEKPLVKAGNRYFKMKQRNRYYPHVSGMAMNAVAHPYGGSRSSKLGKVAIAPRFAPPGRKVGLLHPSRSGRGRKQVK